ncbi:MAG: hypothetical protein NVV66_18160 [Cellulomonas sp.]|uniref:hypothetical protein n=1 Tax=Cellulomonas sp. TaxID=40001 RepID=UPI002590F543|nr:hypothetical protein [Cellulomonas sp.]MCR6706521.1 hypothetical protein [Cellulomonas sp.]
MPRPDVDHDAHIAALDAALDELDAFAHGLANGLADRGAHALPDLEAQLHAEADRVADVLADFGPEPDVDIRRALGLALAGTDSQPGGAPAPTTPPTSPTPLPPTGPELAATGVDLGLAIFIVVVVLVGGVIAIGISGIERRNRGEDR